MESAEFADDFPGGVGAARTRQACPGMRPRTAEKKAANRRFVARPIEHGPHGEKLVQDKFSVKNVAARESIGSLQILGRDDLHALDKAGEIRRVRGESPDYRVAEFPAARVPIPFSQFVRRELNVGGEDVPAVG